MAVGYYAQFRADLEATEARVRGEIQWQLGGVSADLRTQLTSGMSTVHTEMQKVRADLLKRVLIYWAGSVLAIFGLLFTAVGLLRR